MNRTALIRRITSPLLLTLTLALGMSSLAQQPLPLPAAAGAPAVVRTTPDPISPINNALLIPDMDLTWTDTGDDDYTIKITSKLSGIWRSTTVDGATVCGGGTCSWNMADNGFYVFYAEGEPMKWSVKGKSGGVTNKGSVGTFIIHGVETPQLTTPVGGATYESADGLVWTNTELNSHYKVYVRDTVTGTVSKTPFSGMDCGASNCDIPLHFFVTSHPGRTYKWWVRAFGFEGQKARSAKTTFVTPLS